MTFLKRISQGLCSSLLAASLLACGGGGGGGGGGVSSPVGDPGGDPGSSPVVPNTSDTGSVTLLATDAPTDLFSAINLTVLGAEIFGEDGRVTLFSGEKTIDLLQLEQVTEVFSVTEVPAGYYNKIRLTLDSIELVFNDETRAPEYPRLPGNGKLDLNPRGQLYVDAETPLTVELDFDAGKSIHIVQAGKAPAKFNFRPVVFIKKVEGEFDTKLVRQSGLIANLDTQGMSFDLCLADESGTGEGDDCVLVDAGQVPASVFGEFADAIDFESLQDGNLVTVVGRVFQVERAGDDETVGQQVVLVADLLWLGEQISRTENIACSSVMSDGEFGEWFANRPEREDDEACGGQGDIVTSLQAGARVYDDDGKPAGPGAIRAGIENTVDGYLDTSGDTPVLKALVVMLDDLEADDAETERELEGYVGSLEQDSLVLITDEGDRCVVYGPETVFYASGEDDEGTNTFGELDSSILEVGQELEVYGEQDSQGCLVADTILIEDDESDEERDEDEDEEDEEEDDEEEEDEEEEEEEDEEDEEEEEEED